VGRINRIAPWALGLAAVALIASGPAVAQVPSAPTEAVTQSPELAATEALLAMRRRVRGYFRVVPGADNAARRDAAIRHTASALFALIRPLAVSRLTEANPVFPVVRIAFADGDVDVATPPILARSPEQGAARTVRGLNGETNNLTQRLTTAGLTQTTWTDEGSRTTRFVPAADGQHLSLHVVIRSPRLSIPVDYQLEYVRAN